MSSRENAYLALARYLAAKSPARMRHGAVLAKGGRILGTGFNKPRNNPFVCSPEHIKTHCSTHAEVAAIKDAAGNTKGATLYVARIGKCGEDRDSKPCPACQAAIDKAGIRRIVYTRGPGRQLLPRSPYSGARTPNL